MKIIIKSILAFFLLTPFSYADSPAMPRPYVETSNNGQYLIKMIPAQYQKEGPPIPFVGIVYKLEVDGELTELWRISDRYSFEVYLSKDGHYLVSMGPWNVGHEPADDDLAVSFYGNGTLLKSYSTSDLVKDKNAVARSVSHYMWLSRDKVDCNYQSDSSLDAQLRIDWTNTFHLKTIDGVRYEFDVTTGEIAKKVLPKDDETEECVRKR